MTAANEHQSLVDLFLECACWDHHVHGRGDHRMYDFAAQRHLIHHPEIAKDSLYTAVVCGEVTEVGRILAERPAAANEAGGARGWPPLLYLCYARFSHQPTIDNAVTIGRMLLDHGADPNAFYQAYNSRYTALVGVAGKGSRTLQRSRTPLSCFSCCSKEAPSRSTVRFFTTRISGATC